ncbi:polysaccharide deacetylase family protein [Myxosarcina sp. GI1(2024)]
MINLPQGLVGVVAKLFPDAIFYKPTQEKVVALTIDDAPSFDDPDDLATQLILDAIAKHNARFNPSHQVKATFFIISNHIEDHSDILQKIVNQGHEIGNHGTLDTTHAWLSAREFEKQLQEAQEKLLSLTGKSPIRWYRPGRAFYNRQMLKAIERLTEREDYEMKLVLASMIPVDTYDLANHPRLTAWYVRQLVFPGAILVFHAGSAKVAQQTATALGMILDELKQKGYRVVSMSELWDLY